MRHLQLLVSNLCFLAVIVVTTVLVQSFFVVNGFSISVVSTAIPRRRTQTTTIKARTRTIDRNRNRNRYRYRYRYRQSLLSLSSSSSSSSIPFIVNDYYDKSIDDKVNEKTNSNSTSQNNKLVIGINKYSHDTSICIADSTTGQILIAISKERIGNRRTKYDSGNIASLMDICFDYLNNNSKQVYNIDTNSIHSVIMNNHHHRIIPYIENENNTQHMEWESSLHINGGTEDGYDDIENTFLLDSDNTNMQNRDQQASQPTQKIQKIELSHHLAHAYSTICQTPIEQESGLCFVMDGMGESYRTMMYNSKNSNDYISDLSFTSNVLNNVITIPSNINELIKSSVYDYREGESIYQYSKNYTSNTICIYPIFKRYISENIPPTLYNHGFDSMTSIGAIYSRTSTHIFGNWNSCGKVMGLAPWYNYTWNISSTPDSKLNSKSTTTTTNTKNTNTNTIVQPTHYNERIMWGKLYSEHPKEKFHYNRTLLEGMAFISRNDPDLFQYTTTGNKDDTSLTMKKRYDFDDNDQQQDQTQNQNDNNNQNNNPKLPTKVALDAIGLAYRIQNDIEDIILDLVQHFVTVTNETNICLAGGVALNSVVNGKISRYIATVSNTTGNTFISPYPGDDGIAIGCCAYGLFTNPYLQHNHHVVQVQVPVVVQEAVNTTTTTIASISTDTKSNRLEIEENTATTASATATAVKPITAKTTNTATNVQYEPLQGLVTGVPLWKGPVSPYQGPEYTQDDIQDAIDDAITYIDVEYIEDDNQRIDIMINELVVQGNVIALYQSRSEIGPRALGHRSILADPRKKSMVRFINEYVKKRESFRPFAPSVLAEYAHEWFNLFYDNNNNNNNNEHTVDEEMIDRDSMATKNNISPYMSMTATVPVSKRHLIPAVTHVDGSSRIQTVHKQDESFYYKLIKQFFKITGIPMLLNTSFNTIPKEPIVETPANAIRSFLYSQDTISLLVLDKYIIRRKKPNLQSLLGQVTKDGILIKEPAYPKRSGSVQYQSTFTLDETNNNDDSTTGTNTITKVRMPNRILHCTNTNEWYELLDDLEGEILAICDGTVTLNDILSQYTTTSSTDDDEQNGNDDEQNDNLLQNIIHRMVRLYDETLIGW